MVTAIIDHKTITAKDGDTILEASRANGIEIPTLCYLKGINEIGACRVCMVEVKGLERLVASCNNAIEEGMEILTNSPKVREARRTIVHLLLSEHNCQCTSCSRSGNCSLQTLAADLNIVSMPYDKQEIPFNWNMQFPLIRDNQKCIKCMRCVQICDKIQGMNIWGITGTGSRASVNVTGNRKIEEADCTLCGQCVTHCPVGALRARDDTQRLFEALADPDKIVTIQIAPAVRAAWGEQLGLSRETATAGKLVAALRKMGANRVFDTSWAADLTVMEEAGEFVRMLKNKNEHCFPLFTSCCPGWVRFLKSQYPGMVDRLSSAKSPQQMFGAMTKSYYADILKIDPQKIFCVAIMPCIAKKQECDLPTINSTKIGQDVDLVLTTREVARLIRAEHIKPAQLEEESFDTAQSASTGAGIIFGASGGVMEAALRTAHFLLTGEDPPTYEFRAVRGMQGWKESTFEIAGTTLHVAVVSGLGNARMMMEALRSGEVKYDFVEVMACPGGCGGGGGQPIRDGSEMAPERINILYDLDAKSKIHFAHENESIKQLYNKYLKEPGSAEAIRLLHTDNAKWDMPLSPALKNERH